ncbi:uncharacterized protein LOC128887823 [Hylaeus anthracinus]|uniref:uncharacterized protein LOC128887823 n=1 Tax=Hylaeus anthracinus TaxID=313031 RepID=UPI0023B8C37D|nr:uncharacterized protein LOC128887823 [Hylaeus anthracinus]XP_054000168.1 uncharacterized protein LOC128887823 [Hylaeus anthracinus]
MGRKKARGKRATAHHCPKVSKDNCSNAPSTPSFPPKEEEKSTAIDETCKSDTCPQNQVTDVLIDVHSRLMYPLVEQSEDLSDESDEDAETIELNVRPRFVYVASLCAVCLEKSKIFCDDCRMVSYCSPNHRTQGQQEHSDLCAGLSKIRFSIATMLTGESDELLDAEQYRVYRMQLLAILESEIGRPLKLWEKEIVLYPMVCRVCRRFQEDPICCSRCSMETLCNHHPDEHGKWCKEFQVLRRCLVLQHRHGCVDPRIPNARQSSPLALSGLGFDELMHGIYGNCSYYREMDSYTYSTLSHLGTIPLTTLYSMQIACPEWSSATVWTVHVVGAEFQFEGVNLHVWEKLFLHFLPNLKTLRVLLVGPELRLPNGVPAKLLSKVKRCTECRATNRSVEVSFQPERLYHELVRSERVSKPDLICAFNAGLYRSTGFAGEDTWPETIREFCKTLSPIVITSYTADEMVWEIARINSMSDVDVLLEPRRNPFASIKPDRNFVSDDTNPLIYKNYYITVVKGKTNAQ